MSRPGQRGLEGLPSLRARSSKAVVLESWPLRPSMLSSLSSRPHYTRSAFSQQGYRPDIIATGKGGIMTHVLKAFLGIGMAAIASGQGLVTQRNLSLPMAK